MIREEVADIIRIKQTGHKFRVMKRNIYVASSRQWRLAILAYWCCLADVVSTRRQDGCGEEIAFANNVVIGFFIQKV